MKFLKRTAALVHKEIKMGGRVEDEKTPYFLVCMCSKSAICSGMHTVGVKVNADNTYLRRNRVVLCCGCPCCLMVAVRVILVADDCRQRVEFVMSFFGFGAFSTPVGQLVGKCVSVWVIMSDRSRGGS